MSFDLLELTELTASHALVLRQSVGAIESIQIAPTGSKAVMLAALQAAEIAILVTFAHIPLDECNSRPVCGIWTLHDLIGHLADWDRYFTNWLTTLRGGKQQDLYWNDNGDAFNTYLQQQRKGEAWDETWHAFRTQRTTLLHTLAQVSNDDFMLLHLPSADMPFPSVYHCAWSALEHYLDHAAGVRRALALALPNQLLYFHGPYTD